MTDGHIPSKTATLYATRDHYALSPQFERHMLALTAEGLESKSAIAAELAFRDIEIERQRATIEFVSKQLHSVKPDWNVIWRWLDDSIALDGNKQQQSETNAQCAKPDVHHPDCNCLERERRDAARYRFLRQPGNAIVYAKDRNCWGAGASGHVKYDTAAHLDAAVDAAMGSPSKANEQCLDPYCCLPRDHEGDHDDTPSDAQNGKGDQP